MSKKLLGNLSTVVTTKAEYEDLKQQVENSRALYSRLEDYNLDHVKVSDPSVSSLRCFLRDSGTGAKTLVMNPEDHVIEGLRMRSDANKNDFHVRNAAPVLFQSASLHHNLLKMTEERCLNMFMTEQEDCLKEVDKMQEQWFLVDASSLNCNL
ncbi:hypothetical protein C5167_036184 [Papaver somniferum]|nr:hypothetical protein C5167_036184 [Papaver somniferum]